MANIVVRKTPVREPRPVKEKKFKKFKVSLEFIDRDDAMNVAQLLQDYEEGKVSRYIVDQAYR